MRLADLMEPEPRNQYYLRRLWKDPLVKDGKWGLVYAGPGGELIDPNASAPPGETGIPGLGSPFPSPSAGSPFASPPPGSGATPGQTPQLTGLGQPAGAAPFGIAAGGLDPDAGGKQLGGAPIAGVRTLATDEPFRVYNGQTEYSQWLFTYFDLERAQVPGALRAKPGQPASPFGHKPPGGGLNR
jgi:hypothetical protein